MKKNKTVAYALAATLLVGATFVGTKAWFTDKSSISDDFEITMGSLETSADYTESWKIDKGVENSTLDTYGGKVELDNAKPGDKISRAFYVKNGGSLDLEGTVKVEEIDGLNATIEYIGATVGNTVVEEVVAGKEFRIKNLPSEKGSETLFRLHLEVPTELEGQGKEITFSGDVITVTAEQHK